jgi:hypothetical protein
MGSQLPSSSEFLVSVDNGRLEEALASSPSDAKPGTILDDHSFVIELPLSEDARSAWQRLVGEVGAASFVSPIVVDEGEVQHFPTGDVTVRFHSPLSDADLDQFARSNGLELKSRNEFVKEQASFRPTDLRGTYLPDLVEQLEREDAVGTAWLNTRTAYKRA